MSNFIHHGDKIHYSGQRSNQTNRIEATYGYASVLKMITPVPKNIEFCVSAPCLDRKFIVRVSLQIGQKLRKRWVKEHVHQTTRLLQHTSSH